MTGERADILIEKHTLKDGQTDQNYRTNFAFNNYTSNYQSYDCNFNNLGSLSVIQSYTWFFSMAEDWF